MLPAVRPIEHLVNDPSPHFYWQTAKEDLADYKAHSRVCILGKPDLKNRTQLLSAARKLTLLTAALCEITPAKGVLWSAANQLIKADLFVQSALDLAKKGQTPANLWVRLLAVNTTEGMMIGTVGLAPYIGRELEFPYAPQESFGALAVNLLDLSLYLIDNNVDLKVGEVLRSEEDIKGFQVVRIGDGYFEARPSTILEVEE